MSNEENANKTESETPVKETETAEQSANQAASAAKEAAGNLVSKILDLKANNPKAFFGIIGGVVLVLLILMMSGGDESKPSLAGPSIKNLAVGQKYVLKSPNTYDKDATIRLVAVPGTMAAYDDTEEDDRSGACKHMPQGTPVTVLEFMDAYGKKNAFVKVQMEEGECKGQSGWALAIDVQ
jgi:hypothetical protein